MSDINFINNYAVIRRWCMNNKNGWEIIKNLN